MGNSINNKKKIGIVCKYGVNDVAKRTHVNGVSVRSYDTWTSMLKRCYSKKVHNGQPSYIGCSVCDEWLYFSNFLKWYDENYIEGNYLDKDILKKGNKIYSPETCCFVPNEINVLFTKRYAKRGKYPIGISYYKNINKFRASISVNSKQMTIGYFDDPYDAFNAYKVSKEAQIKKIAEAYYKKGRIRLNVYNAMINYKVEITD